MELCQILVHSNAEQQDSKYPDWVTNLKDTFNVVFSHTKDLSPHQVVSHTIPILPGAVLMNCRPYHYSYCQTNEIKQFIQKLLTATLIQHSSSLLESPSLLMKKKDAGWRFCVDYWALNKTKMPNCFPVPVV